MGRRIAIVGASVAGLCAAQALRAQGWDGELVLVGDEPHLPYERPALSKEVLVGAAAGDDLALLTEEARHALGATWLLGRRAVGLDAERRTLRLHDGTLLPADGIVVATGARARRLPTSAGVDGVLTLRSLDDAHALRAALRPGARLTIVGAGLIGLEVASAAAALGCRVTILSAVPDPFAGHVGALCASLLTEVLDEAGVRLVRGAVATGIAPGGDGAGRAVALASGAVVESDIVLVCIGSEAEDAWLAGSGVTCDAGVLTDALGRTNVARVVAVGDVARYRSRRLGGAVRVEHWSNARTMPAIAAAALLADLRGDACDALAPHDPLPYFWSDQFGHRIQVAGRVDPSAPEAIVEGSVRERSFLAVQRGGDATTAIVAWDRTRAFAQLRRATP